MLLFRVLTRLPARLHYSVSTPASSPRPTLAQKRDPFFSTTYTLFSIHNFAHPFSFVTTAHSLAKTPGVPSGLSNQILAQRKSLSQNSCSCATPIESKRSTKIVTNPSRMKTFHDTPGGGVGLSDQILASSKSHRLTPMESISFKYAQSNPFRIYLFRKQVGVGVGQLLRAPTKTALTQKPLIVHVRK